MKGAHAILFVLVAISWQASAGDVSSGVQDSKVRAEAGNAAGAADIRPKRQTETSAATAETEAPKPKKPRPSNIFGLFSVLLTETRDDANRAFNEIGTLFNSQFVNSTTTKEPTSTTTTTPSSSESSDSDESEEMTTTTEFAITRNEFFGILRSNVQGIVNLLGKEFRVAIKDSNENAREFGRDLGLALRPYFSSNSNQTKSSK